MTRVIKDQGTSPEKKRTPPPNLNKEFGITKEDISKRVDTPYIIDINKKQTKDGKPRFTT